MSDKACMSIDSNTEALAVVGDPIEHTFSPYIHQILIEATGDNFAYVPFHIAKNIYCRNSLRLGAGEFRVSMSRSPQTAGVRGALPHWPGGPVSRSQ